MRHNQAKSIWAGVALNMILPLFVVAEIHASVHDVHDIIDICTSSERIMKDYAMIGMKMTYNNPQKELDKTIKRMDKKLERLEKHKISKALHEEEIALHKEWVKIEEELKKPITKKNGLTLYHHINTFAKHCEVLAEHLAKDTGNAAEHYAVLISRLNLDVQELTAIYIMKTWDAIEDDEYYNEVKRILEDVISAYDELQTAEANMVSDKVKSKLKKVRKHFMALEMMAESKTGRRIPILIAKKAKDIDNEIEEILKLEESEVEK